MIFYLLVAFGLLAALIARTMRGLQFINEAQEFKITHRSQLPSTLSILYKAILISFLKPEGTLKTTDASGKAINPFPASKALYSTRLSRKELAEYANICKFKGSEEKELKDEDSLRISTICFIEVLSLPLMTILGTAPSFPLSAFGLIHIRNSIIQYKEIQPDQKLEISCGIGGHKITEQGVEIHGMIEAKDEAGTLLWSCITTLLSRNKKTRENQGNRTHKPSSESEETKKWEKRYPVRIPSNIGVNYAKISGDWNPHHLWPITAKMMSYPRPIVHGMWSLACCVREMRQQLGNQFPEFPLQIDVSWKRPIYFPNEVLFSYMRGTEDYNFYLFDKDGNTPHLYGALRSLQRK